jgi:uncharacterized membrane protein
MGPVQVLVVGFDRATFSGEVLEELTKLGQAGIVRLVDLLVVSRADDGTIETIDPPAELAGASGHLAAAVFGAGESDGAPDAVIEAGAADGLSWSLAEAIPPGSSAAIALIEHLWAEPLMNAIRRTGGTPLEETWLAPADVEALEALAGR